MNNKLVSLLTAVCIVLILIIIGEWFYAMRAQKQALTSTASSETKISHDEMPGIELTRQPEESYEALVSRPLFVKGRKPVDEPSPEEVQANSVVNTFDWELNGVYTTKKGLSALFSRSMPKVLKDPKEPKDNYRKISADADLDGWKLKEIHKDRAILSQGNQQKELLLRKPKPKELPRQANIPKIPNAPNMPNTPNIPQPTEGVPDIPQPAEGEFENNNE